MIKFGSVGHGATLQKAEFLSAGKGADEIKLYSCELSVAVSFLHLVPIVLLCNFMGNRN